MRGLPALCVLALVPFSGCLGGTSPSVAALTLFDFDLVQRGDASPVPVGTCDDLLGQLNQQALEQARVHLEQQVESYVNQGVHWGGPVLFRDDVAVDVDFAFANTEASGAAAPQALSDSKGSVSTVGAEVTGTNNQEAGVDEGDLLKTDGTWTYVHSRGVLHILHSAVLGDLQEVGTLAIDDGTWGPTDGQLLLDHGDPEDAADDRLVLVLAGQSLQPQSKPNPQSDARLAISGAAIADTMIVDPGDQMTRIVAFSLADRSHPQILSQEWIEGWPAGVRMVGGTAYVVVQSPEPQLGLQSWVNVDDAGLARHGLDWQRFHELKPEIQQAVVRDLALQTDAMNQKALAAATLADHLPRRAASSGPVTAPNEIDATDCARVLATPGFKGRSVSTILAIDVRDPALASTTTQVLAGSSIVYAAEDALVLASTSQDFWWLYVQPQLDEATDLHWFDLDGTAVTHRASGRVPGIVQDSFGIDVQGGELRVATTTGTWGRWWMEEPEPMLNHVIVLDAVGPRLVERGIVGGIAPNERIWSARFTQDRAYIVTFEQTDPLWVIDLSGGPSGRDGPKLLGELEIPGVSTYIHPLDDGALLAVGHGPGPDGLGLDWGRVQVSLFDVSDPAAPRRAAVLDLTPGYTLDPSGSAGWGWSGALQEHKAFTYWPTRGLLALPLTTERGYETHQNGYPEWRYEHHIGLRLIEVDRQAMTLSVHGEVDHDGLLPEQSWGGMEIQRSYFLGFADGPASVYSVSPLGITAHDVATLQQQASVAFPQPDPYYGYPVMID